MSRIDNIDHIVILMMENRSFDHMLGYLSLTGRDDLDGLREDGAFKDTYANPQMSGQPSPVRPATLRAGPLAFDPPHQRPEVAEQLAVADGEPHMTGFVRAAREASKDPATCAQVMGFHTAEDVWVFDDLARNFGVSDRWFASVPTSTMPNRMMYMCGQTTVETTGLKVLPNLPSVFEWLTSLEHDEPLWHYYYENVPYYALLPHKHLAGRIERRVKGGADRFKAAWKSKDRFPPVCFVDPEFFLALNPGSANDDHPHDGSTVTPGQNFVRDIYATLLSNPERFARTLFLVTYDEHGVLFDHAAPPAMTTPCCKYAPFSTLGVRVPLLAVSPYIDAGARLRPHVGVFDHVSILKLLVEKFATGSDDFTRLVNARPVASASELLTRDTAREETWKAPKRRSVAELESAVATTTTVQTSVLAPAFREALLELRGALGPRELEERFPGANGFLASQGTGPDGVGVEGPLADPHGSESVGAELEAAPLPGEYPGSRFEAAGVGHFTVPATGRKVRQIVLHITDGSTAAGAIAHFKTGAAKTSAHYIVDRDGSIVQMVKHAHIAHHARGANTASIGIEHVALSPAAAAKYGRAPLLVTAAQYAASARLVAFLCKLYAIPRDRDHIKGHREVGTTTHASCPDAAWEWPAFLQELSALP